MNDTENTQIEETTKWQWPKNYTLRLYCLKWQNGSSSTFEEAWAFNEPKLSPQGYLEPVNWVSLHGVPVPVVLAKNTWFSVTRYLFSSTRELPDELAQDWSYDIANLTSIRVPHWHIRKFIDVSLLPHS